MPESPPCMVLRAERSLFLVGWWDMKFPEESPTRFKILWRTRVDDALTNARFVADLRCKASNVLHPDELKRESE
jgi:hypothetical protein